MTEKCAMTSQQLAVWSPNSWKSMSVHKQSIAYRDEALSSLVLQRLTEMPPLVSSQDIEHARRQFEAAARGEAFVLMGGDCAESFDDNKDGIIDQKVKLLVSQATSIESQICLPVHVTARLAGQYSKPRSQLMEKQPDGREVWAFRGHNINGPAISEREPDPTRLWQGHWHSAKTLQCLKWAPRPITTAHEALHLPLESAMTTPTGYNTSATFLWLGERTNQLDGAHLEYIRGLRNPIGVKIGPSSADPARLLSLLDILCSSHDNPSDSSRRVTLITRFGADKIASILPSLVDAVHNSPYRPLWMCDPCHGNTIAVDNDVRCGGGGVIKTRCISTMLTEVERTIGVLRDKGFRLGGLHLEQTGEDDIVECINRPIELNSPAEASLVLGGASYRTLCDPRMSGTQARYFADRVAEMLMDGRELPAKDSRQCDDVGRTLMSFVIAPFVKLCGYRHRSSIMVHENGSKKALAG